MKKKSSFAQFIRAQLRVAFGCAFLMEKKQEFNQRIRIAEDRTGFAERDCKSSVEVRIEDTDRPCTAKIPYGNEETNLNSEVREKSREIEF